MSTRTPPAQCFMHVDWRAHRFHVGGDLLCLGHSAMVQQLMAHTTPDQSWWRLTGDRSNNVCSWQVWEVAVFLLAPSLKTNASFQEDFEEGVRLVGSLDFLAMPPGVAIRGLDHVSNTHAICGWQNDHPSKLDTQTAPCCQQQASLAIPDGHTAWHNHSHPESNY